MSNGGSKYDHDRPSRTASVSPTPCETVQLVWPHAEAAADPRAAAEAEARAKQAASAHPVVKEAIEVLDAELRNIRTQTPG